MAPFAYETWPVAQKSLPNPFQESLCIGNYSSQIHVIDI